MNGTIEGMGSDGIRLFGDAITVEKVNAISNGGNGFLLTSSVETYGATSPPPVLHNPNGDGRLQSVRLGIGLNLVVGEADCPERTNTYPQL
jgi:hypothetical protein